VRRYLLPILAALLVEDERDAASRRTLLGFFSEYAEGLPGALASMEQEANEESKLPAKPAETLVHNGLRGAMRFTTARLLPSVANARDASMLALYYGSIGAVVRIPFGARLIIGLGR
jgi:hypothetical protein